jgi:tetratricopeptide (TPR) repeat protein
MNFFSNAIWMANACNYLGELDKALNLLQAVEQLTRLPDVWEMDKMAVLLKYVEIQIANYFLTNSGSDEMFELAQRAYQQAQEQWNGVDFAAGANGHAIDVAKALCLLGQAHYYQTLNTNGNDYSEARTFLQQSLDILEKLAEERKIVVVQWPDSTTTDIEPYEYAKDYGARLIDRHTSSALFLTGLTYERLEEYEQARDYYRQALDLARHADAKEEASYVYRHLAGLSEDKGQQLEYALQSLHLREEIGFKRTLPLSHLLVCDVYLQLNNLEKAQEHCQAAFQLAEEMELKNALMAAFFSQGEIYQCQEKRDEARESFVQSLDLAEELDIAYGIAEATKKLNEIG